MSSNHPQTPIQKSYQIDSFDEDPILPLQVDSYLNTLGDWRNIQEIVRLSIKSLTDTVRSQGLLIRELEKNVQSKSSKSEISTALNMKANSSDVTRSVSEMNTLINQRVTIDEMRSMLNEKVSKSELIYLLNSKASNDDVHGLIDDKVDRNEYQNELTEIKQKIDFIEKEFNKKSLNFVEHTEINNIKTILEQKANFSDMNEALNSKANKENILTLLKSKANKTDIDLLLSNKAEKSELLSLSNTLNMKTDISELDEIKQKVDNCVQQKHFDSIADKLNSKAEANDFKLISDAFMEMKNSMTKRIDDIDQDLDRLIENIKTQFQNLNLVINNIENNKIDYSQFDKLNFAINKKIDSDKIDLLINKTKNEMFETVSNFKNEINTNRKKIEEKNNEKIVALSNDIKNLINEVNKDKDNLNKFYIERNLEKENFQIQTKNLVASSLTKVHDDIFSLKEAVNNFSISFSNDLKTKVDLQNLNDVLMKLNEEISSKAPLSLMEQISQNITKDVSEKMFEAINENKIEISKKISSNELSVLLADKAEKKMLESKVSFSEFEKLKSQFDIITHQINNKISNERFEQSTKALSSSIDEINTTLSLKANIREILSLLKNKAEVDDVNKALTEIHNELDTKNSIDSFSAAMDNQSIINDALCAENCIARWLWKSGKVKNGYAIPWETQNVNTAPDNFIWDKDKTYIICMSPGLYKLDVGFFCDKKPGVQVMVNGEVAISNLSNTTGSVRGKKIGNITGITISEFLLLSEKSKISVSYSGEEGALGFMGIKKF